MAIIWDSYVNPADLTTFVRNVPVRQDYILNQLLPDRVDEVLEVEVADVTQTTRAAKFRAFDAPPMPGQRDQFSIRRVKLPAVSQFLAKGERDRLELERLRQGGQSTKAIEQAIYDDAENNTRSIQARMEQARGDLLTDGKVTLTELGGLEADFGTPGTNFVTAGTLWSNPAADILGDLRAWCKTYRTANGFNPGGMVMSEDILSFMMTNTAIRNLYASTVGTPAVVNPEQLSATLVSNRFPAVRFTYDSQVVSDGSTVNILPDSVVVFLPPQGVELGYTQWGMTATGLEMNNRGIQVDTGLAGLVGVVDKDERPPYRETVYVDGTALPILSNPKALFVATVR